MKKSINRFLSLMLALMMCFSIGTVAFAAETTENTKNTNLTAGDEGIMPCGEISGYAQGTITNDNNTLIVWCDSSAILTSGMGITIKASNANFDGHVDVVGYPKTGTAKSFKTRQLTMGTEITIDDLTHRGCSAYIIEFSGLSEGQSFLAQVWIYG